MMERLIVAKEKIVSLIKVSEKTEKILMEVDELDKQILELNDAISQTSLSDFEGKMNLMKEMQKLHKRKVAKTEKFQELEDERAEIEAILKALFI